MSNVLIPNYMDIDYNTVKARLKDLLSKTNEFKDYNYEGSNISLLIELVSYLSALTTYYGNKIAQNQYIETADMYETVHMLSRLSGYEPKGYVSAYGYVNVTLLADNYGGVIYVNPGESVYIAPWSQLKTNQTDSEGNSIYYSTILPLTEKLTDEMTYPYRLTTPLYVVQGRVVEYNYRGSDIIDGKLYLPLEKFDYNNIELTVNNSDPWLRITNYYDNISDITKENNAYLFKFDKNRRYYIEFSNLRNIPNKTDEIKIKMLISSGADGNMGSGNIDAIDSNDFLINLNTLKSISNKIIDIKNNLATSGGANPESIENIRKSSLVSSHTQYRTVTKNDYIKILEQRNDVVKANVWGENDISLVGNYTDYNKVFISLIPLKFGEETILLNNDEYPQPTSYSESWMNDIKLYLNPYKHISTYEQFSSYEFVYFTFTIGLKIKRTYNFNIVANDIRKKLAYYFNVNNRNFGDEINFLEIKKYIMDPKNISEDDNFININGISTMTIRDIKLLPIGSEIHMPDNDGNLYPRYSKEYYDNSIYDNQLTVILLNYDQFPRLVEKSIEIFEEK
jgi:hypothetical protein